MDVRPDRSTTEVHAACEQTPQPKDGAQAWLGLAVIAVAIATAAALAFAAWRWF